MLAQALSAVLVQWDLGNDIDGGVKPPNVNRTGVKAHNLTFLTIIPPRL